MLFRSLGQILHLDNASGPPTGPVGTVELKHPTSTTIGADCLFHRLILLDRRLGQLLPEKEDFLELCRSGLSISATSFLPRESTSSPLSESHCFICCTELGLSKAVSFFMAAVSSARERVSISGYALVLWESRPQLPLGSDGIWLFRVGAVDGV